MVLIRKRLLVENGNRRSKLLQGGCYKSLKTAPYLDEKWTAGRYEIMSKVDLPLMTVRFGKA